jgi:hypothetical protein
MSFEDEDDDENEDKDLIGNVCPTVASTGSLPLRLAD